MSIPTRVPRRIVVRELLAIVLIVAGVAGLIFAAFRTSLDLGIAATSAAVIAAGVYLGYDR